MFAFLCSFACKTKEKIKRVLFENGKTGYFSESSRQGHTPIAIVFALHRAIALWDANGGAKAKFDADNYHNWGQRNFKMFFIYEEGLGNTTSSQV